MGFPKIRGTFLGVPIIRTIIYMGPPIEGSYHIILLEYPCSRVLYSLLTTSKLMSRVGAQPGSTK